MYIISITITLHCIFLLMFVACIFVYAFVLWNVSFLSSGISPVYPLEFQLSINSIGSPFFSQTPVSYFSLFLVRTFLILDPFGLHCDLRAFTILYAWNNHPFPRSLCGFISDIIQESVQSWLPKRCLFRELSRYYPFKFLCLFQNMHHC